MTETDDLSNDILTVQQISDAITDAVRDGRLVPGQRLTEIDFARRLGVSRPSVREAFRQLTADGLLHSQPYRGVSVRHMTRREVDDLFIVRGALEGLAVRLATPTLQNDASQLLAIQTELDTAEARKDLADMSRYNLAFHRLFADITGNALLREQLRRISNSVYWLQFRVLVADDKVLHTNTGHRDIVEAVRCGNAAAAEAIMIDHVDHSRRLVQSLPDSHFAESPAD